MSDLISRQKAIKRIKELPNSPNGFSGAYDKATIILALEDVEPVENVAPVVHAHWIVDVWDSYGVRNCSNCGGYGNDTHIHYGRTHGDVDGFRIKPLPYCPHCGAKMDEEDDHEQ